MPGNYDDCPCHSHREGDDLRIRGRTGPGSRWSLHWHLSACKDKGLLKLGMEALSWTQRGVLLFQMMEMIRATFSGTSCSYGKSCLILGKNKKLWL